jgi:hypothetical protein
LSVITKEISRSDIDKILSEKESKKLDIPDKKDKLHYVNNKELHNEFVIYHAKKIKWKESGKDGVPPYGDIIGKAILQISNNALYAPRFIGYSNNWKIEMKDLAIDHCVRFCHGYNPHFQDSKPLEERNPPNPFSYLTQICRNAYLQVIKRESKEKYTQYKYLVERGFEGFTSDVGKIDEKYLREVYEYIDRYDKIISDLKEIKLQKQIEKELINAKTNP